MSVGQFGLGSKALKAYCRDQSVMTWFKAKLSADMFRPAEQPTYEWVQAFVHKHHALPQIETLVSQFPEMGQYPVPEPSTYYLEHLEARLYHERINQANIASQTVLKDDPKNSKAARVLLSDCLNYIKAHEYRMQIVDVANEGPGMVLTAYHNILLAENVGVFGWPYMDSATGGIMPGDVVTIIGRPSAGKTWLVLYTAIANWMKGKRVMVVSMEMAPLPILQRISAMYTHSNITQLKLGGYSSASYQKFATSLTQMTTKNEGFFVVDGNLAASVEDVYTLAAQMKIDVVLVDGAYLLRHPNKRLDRFARVAENAELIKQLTSQTGVPTVASYQFARTASKGKPKGEVATLDDIGSSDVIGQVSSIALGLFEDESVETIQGRVVRVLKGRNGEIGQFRINWDFAVMDFDQQGSHDQDKEKLEYI